MSVTTRIISRKLVAELLDHASCISAIENVFRIYGEGKAPTPGILATHVKAGGFHIKAGTLSPGRDYYVAKINANFPGNPAQNGLPTIQGIVAVFDALDGRLLALMDSMEITILRTGAATAVAAKYLARPGANTVCICGCGNQGRVSLKMLASLFPLKRAYAFDSVEASARSFAREMSDTLGLEVIAVDKHPDACRQSSVIVTCTTSRQAFLSDEDISPGTFIAAVGADSEDKQELDPHLLARSKVVVDVLSQAATIGELHHALEKGLLSRSDVHAELGEVVARKKPSRQSDAEIIVFDSTGMGLQDVASAALVYEKAEARNLGLTHNFGER